MSTHRIAIIADTHSLLRPEVKDILLTCEVILHAGDIAGVDTYEEISAITESYFVRGNADKDWAENVPRDLLIELYGFIIYMVHNKSHIGEDAKKADFIVYGHSHKYEVREENGATIINPGSCGPRRFIQDVTMAVLTVDQESHTFSVEKIDLSPTFRHKEMKLPPKDMDKLIRNIMKDMNANRAVDEIARRNRVENEFVNQILQIYTTHPGIDVDGILNRMDILGK